METIRITILACWCLLGGYLLFDNSWFYLSGWVVVTAGGLYLLTRKPAEERSTEEGVVESEAAQAVERPTPPPPPLPAENRTVEPTVSSHEDRWDITTVRGPTWTRLPDGLVGFFDPWVGGKPTIHIGPTRRFVLGPGTLYVTDAGEKTFSFKTGVQMPALSAELVRSLSRGGLATVGEGMTEYLSPEALETLRTTDRQLEAMRTLGPSPETLGAISSLVTMEIKLTVRLSNRREDRRKIRRFFTHLALPTGQDPAENIYTIMEEEALNTVEDLHLTVDDLIRGKRREYGEEVRQRIGRILGQYGLRTIRFSITDILYEEDVQDYLDNINKMVREAAARITETRLEIEARRQQVLSDAQLAIVEAQGQASALKKRAEGDADAILTFVSALKRRGIKDQGALTDILTIYALRDIESSGLFLNLGGGRPADSVGRLTSMFQGMSNQLKEIATAVRKEEEDK